MFPRGFSFAGDVDARRALDSISSAEIKPRVSQAAGKENRNISSA